MSPGRKMITKAPRTAHTAIITPAGEGFLVTCPHGCNLGTSARRPDKRSAESRVEVHYLATAPLTRREPS